MKYKCQCPTPKDHIGFLVADRYCERCGATLCSQCQADIPAVVFEKKRVRLAVLCQSCADIEESFIDTEIVQY